MVSEKEAGKELVEGENGTELVEVELGLRGTDPEVADGAGDDDAAIGQEAKEEKPPPAPTVPLSRLFRFATTYELLLTSLGLVSAALSGVVMPLTVLPLRGFLNTLGEGDNDEPLFEQIGDDGKLYGYLAAAAGFSAFFQGTFLMTSASRQCRRIRMEFMNALMRQDVSFFDETPAGKIASRMADVDKIKEGQGKQLGMLVQAFVQLITGLTVGLIINWRISLVALSMIPAMAVALGVLMMIITRITGDMRSSSDKQSSAAAEIFSNLRTVAAFSMQDAATDIYEKEAETIENKSITVMKSIGFSFGAFMFLINAAYALAMWYGSTEVEDDTARGGDVLATFFAILMGGLALAGAPVQLKTLVEAREAGHELFEIIDRRPKIDSSSDAGLKPESCQGEIELKDVHFAYPTRPDVEIFSGYNLKIEAGKTVAIVGASGGGKSTVISLMERFYDPSSGQVLVDGIDAKELNVNWLRSQIGLVSQEPVLFATSIRENIRHGKRDATDEEVEAAAKKANAHDFILGFSDGYETQVGERGIQLSGGQKQRVAIARAIIKEPKILLLDEATSALDSESEAIVQAALDELMAETSRTTVIVAHRLSTIRNADIIAVCYEGRLVEQGTHEELMAIPDGFYSNLIALQTAVGMGDDQAADGARRPSLDIVPPSLVRAFTSDSDAGTDRASYGKGEEKTDGKLALRESESAGTSGDTAADKAKGTGEPDDNIMTVSLDTIDGKKLRAMQRSGLNKFSKWRLWEMNRPEWPLLSLGFLGATVGGVSSPLQALFLASIVDSFFKEDDQMRREANLYAWLFLGLGAVNFFGSLAGWPLGVGSARLMRRIRVLFFKSALHQDMSVHDRMPPGFVTSQLVQDMRLIERGHAYAFNDKMRLLGTAVALIVICLVYSWQLTLVLLGIAPIILFVASLQSVWWKSKTEDEASKLEVKTVTETVGNARTVIACQLQKTVSETYTASLEGPTKRDIDLSMWEAFYQALATFVNVSAYCCVFAIGSVFIDEGYLTFRQLLVTMLAVMFSAPSLGQQASGLPDEVKAEIACARLFQMIDRRPKIDSSSDAGLKPESCQGEIELKDVHFAYPTRPDVEIFSGYNLKIEAGKTVAIVGASGGGKSTVISLMERFYDPSSGQVLVDGIDAKELNVNWLRSQIGLVSQEPVLFATSIRENIRHGKRDATDEEVEAAAKKANAHDFILGFSDGYETQVGERGIQLSGGQKQRVAIARAIIKEPKILLLDEATSALDSESEAIVQAALDELLLKHARTTVIVAHRLSTIRNADIIAVCYEGRLVEQGTHEELMAIPDGHYLRLTRNQESAEAK